MFEEFLFLTENPSFFKKHKVMKHRVINVRVTYIISVVSM